MKICIVRHGSTEPGAVHDQSRVLTERGQAQVQAAGKWLSEQPLNCPQILASPYRRAQQTAQAIADLMRLSVETLPLLTPDADINALISDLQARNNDLILVSHLPLVGHLSAYLTEGEVFQQPWSPAEVWTLEGDIAGPACMTVGPVWYPVLDGI